jgi:FlaA1/EpsC-like NDP-sugar epimerase
MNRPEETRGYPWIVRRLKLPIQRYVVPSSADGLLVVVALFVALRIRFTGQVPPQWLQQTGRWALFAALVYVGFNFGWRVYGRCWRYATSRDVIVLVEAVGFATLLLAAIDLLQGASPPLPLSVVVLGGLFSLLLMLVVRCQRLLLAKARLGWRTTVRYRRNRVRALIVGAGDHGRRLARHLRDDPVQKTRYQAMGFVDDDQSIAGLRVDGLKVMGMRHDIPALVKRWAIDQIIIASRTSFGDTFDELVSICQETPARIKVLPRFCDLLDDESHFPNLHDLTIEDLLERDTVQIDHHTCRRALAGRVILVTGAGGSIGSELCRQLLNFDPRLLLLVDNNETSLHDLCLELREEQSEDQATELCLLIADITNVHKMTSIFACYAPQVVFHAAAYKHVPVLEAHPDEAVRVNVMGTVVLTDLADRFGTERFIFISTDKAVNPSCVMGASKRIGEQWIASRQSGSRTKFASVRFGNVVGSRGSVIPLFTRQIERGGPVTVNDPRMTRYFMSIPEAASLIIQAGAFATGGEIYMLDMGRQLRIVDLAQKMIRLKGLCVGRDVQIRFIGIRPGEKLHEELSYQTERRRPTAHPKIYCLEDDSVPDRSELLGQVAVLEAASQSTQAMIARLREGLILLARGDADGFLEALTALRFSLGGRQPAARRAETVTQHVAAREAGAGHLRPVIQGSRSDRLEGVTV